MRIYSAIGSTAPHAAYVDQGTSAFMAKTLPPWTRGGSTLYKAGDWVADGQGGSRRLPEIPVSGQRAQNFFDKGLVQGFRIMGLAAAPAPGIPGLTEAVTGFPSRLENFVGNTPADGAFIAQLQEWRAWRDAAWQETRAARYAELRRERGRYQPRRASQETRRRWWREAQQRRRDAVKKGGGTKKPTAEQKAQAAINQARAEFLIRVFQRYGDASNGTRYGDATFVTLPGGAKVWQIKVTLRNGETRTLQDKVKFSRT
jgi:hypothetical protein